MINKYVINLLFKLSFFKLVTFVKEKANIFTC